MCIFPIGETAACQHCAEVLRIRGFPLTDHPSPDVTHVLLDVPSFQPDGQLRCGGSLESLLEMLPSDICIIGGNLSFAFLKNYHKIDLLSDPLYLSLNAAITADCAVRLAAKQMSLPFYDASALVIGWGRIGKCLASLLQRIGCRVTVVARKEHDRAMLKALHYGAISIEEIPKYLEQYQLLFNTVPYPVLNTPIPGNCISIELASQPGIPIENTIDGRGLPGRMAAESSGTLIAESILRLIQEDLI